MKTSSEAVLGNLIDSPKEYMLVAAKIIILFIKQICSLETVPRMPIIYLFEKFLQN